MRSLPAAAGMLRRDRGQQRGRKECPDKREQQQEFCGQVLHSISQ